MILTFPDLKIAVASRFIEPQPKEKGESKKRKIALQVWCLGAHTILLPILVGQYKKKSCAQLPQPYLYHFQSLLDLENVVQPVDEEDDDPFPFTQEYHSPDHLQVDRLKESWIPYEDEHPTHWSKKVWQGRYGEGV